MLDTDEFIRDSLEQDIWAIRRVNSMYDRYGCSTYRELVEIVIGGLYEVSKKVV